jgi:hypothetical protein
MCFVRISEQTATCALCSVNRLALYNRSGVFTARYALSPYIKQIRFVFKGLIYSSCFSHHKFGTHKGRNRSHNIFRQILTVVEREHIAAQNSP